MVASAFPSVFAGAAGWGSAGSHSFKARTRPPSSPCTALTGFTVTMRFRPASWAATSLSRFTCSSPSTRMHLRARVVEDVGEILRAILHVERHDHEAVRVRALVVGNPLAGVAQHDRDAVSGLEAFGGESGAHPAREPRDLRPLVEPPRLDRRVVLAVGHGAGRERHAPREHVGDGVPRLDGYVVRFTQCHSHPPRPAVSNPRRQSYAA